MIRTGRYDFIPQERIIFGAPAAEAVIEECARLKAARVFIVASQTLSRRTDVVSGIRAALGERFAGLFDETVAHVPRASVLAAAAAMRGAAPDLIVTIGGGTPIDTVKVALICLAHDVRDAAALGDWRAQADAKGALRSPVTKAPPVRQIIVPTTLSGAEFSSLGGATDPARQIKDGYFGIDVCGQAVILDPAVTVHTPEWLWLSTGMRAVDHAVESLCSTAPQPFTDATSAHGLGMLARSLRRTKANPADPEARLESQMGVWLATTGLARIPWGASHGIGHQLGAVAGVPHGHTSCVLLPAVLRYNKPANAAQQAAVSAALGDPAREAADLVAELVADLGQPGTLREVGVRRDQFAAIAAGSLENFFVRQNPRPITRAEDIVEILEMAW